MEAMIKIPITPNNIFDFLSIFYFFISYAFNFSTKYGFKENNENKKWGKPQ